MAICICGCKDSEHEKKVPNPCKHHKDCTHFRDRGNNIIITHIK